MVLCTVYFSNTKCVIPLLYVGCQTGWTSAMNMHSPNGKYQASLTSLTACQQGCIAEPSCLAVDVKDGNQCWFHDLSTNYMNTKTGETGVIQYVLNRCVGKYKCSIIA